MNFGVEYENIRGKFENHAKKDTGGFFKTRFAAVMGGITPKIPLEISSENGVRVVFRKNDAFVSTAPAYKKKDERLIDLFVDWIKTGKAATETGYTFTLDEGEAGGAAIALQSIQAPPPPLQAAADPGQREELRRLIQKSEAQAKEIAKLQGEKEDERAENEAKLAVMRAECEAKLAAERAENAERVKKLHIALRNTTHRFDRLSLDIPPPPPDDATDQGPGERDTKRKRGSGEVGKVTSDQGPDEGDTKRKLDVGFVDQGPDEGDTKRKLDVGFVEQGSSKRMRPTDEEREAAAKRLAWNPYKIAMDAAKAVFT
jgi:hypothetical protein